jgi:DNA topoisomerase-1
MNLMIVESPTKEKTISKFLGKEFVIKSSYGHVRDLPVNSLGVDVENDFTPSYTIVSKVRKTMSALKETARKAKKIYLATDYDREGEAIAWHLTQVLGINEKKAQRVTFHEITPEAIKEALKNPRGLDMDLVDSQQARRILDRLVGYKLSPLLWKKIARGLSAGRVQSVAVRFIVERENEIKNFSKKEYWTVSVKLSENGDEFEAAIVSKGGQKIEREEVFDLFADRYKVKLTGLSADDAGAMVKELAGLSYMVSSVESKKALRSPGPPFTTSTMQQDAVRKAGFSAYRAMRTAQELYEGVQSDDGMVGMITYHRTDSVSVAAIAQDEAERYIKEKIGAGYYPEKRKFYKTKQVRAQEAHECIRPTSVYRDPESLRKNLTPDQYKLYKLIWQRFVASQMADAKYDSVNVEITAGDYILKASGRVLTFAGYLKIYGENQTEENGEGEGDGEKKMLPPLKEGDMPAFVEAAPRQHSTEPPPRYNEASLIKTLEKNGIGRPSTYAPTVSTILNRRYVMLQDRKFYPTELGGKTTDLLKEYFPDIVDINFTAGIEDRLDVGAEGGKRWVEVVKDFYGPFSAKLAIADKNIVQRAKPELTDKKCPVCGEPMYLKESRFGKFYSCSKWPKCKGKQNA